MHNRIWQRIKEYMEDPNIIIIRPLACFATPRCFENGSYIETKCKCEKKLKNKIKIPANRGSEHYLYSDEMRKYYLVS